MPKALQGYFFHLLGTVAAAFNNCYPVVSVPSMKFTVMYFWSSASSCFDFAQAIAGSDTLEGDVVKCSV